MDAKRALHFGGLWDTPCKSNHVLTIMRLRFKAVSYGRVEDGRIISINRGREGLGFEVFQCAVSHGKNCLRRETIWQYLASWLLQLGLTNRETIATIAMSLMSKKSKREEAIRNCLKGLSMTEYQISSALKSYSACAVIEKSAEVLKWARGLEDIFLCDLRQMEKRKEAILSNLGSCIWVSD